MAYVTTTLRHGEVALRLADTDFIEVRARNLGVGFGKSYDLIVKFREDTSNYDVFHCRLTPEQAEALAKALSEALASR
jgi:predicted DNA binding protein